MLAHHYRIWDWGDERDSQEESAEGNSVTYAAGIFVLAKRNDSNPFEVYNELVAMALGRAIGLPVPIGFVLSKDGFAYYASGDITLSPGAFPPADFETFAVKEPDVACGTAVFDCWIANYDRHDRNLFYDEDEGRVFLIDHGNALLNRYGRQNCSNCENLLSLHPSFASSLRDLSAFCSWAEKIRNVPDYMIRDATRLAMFSGIDTADSDALADFLIARKSRLVDLFSDNEQYFSRCDFGLFSPWECDQP